MLHLKPSVTSLSSFDTKELRIELPIKSQSTGLITYEPLAYRRQYTTTDTMLGIGGQAIVKKCIHNITHKEY